MHLSTLDGFRDLLYTIFKVNVMCLQKMLVVSTYSKTMKRNFGDDIKKDMG